MSYIENTFEEKNMYSLSLSLEKKVRFFLSDGEKEV